MTQNHRTWPALTIALIILPLALGAALVFGQGGSGRAPQNGSGRGDTNKAPIVKGDANKKGTRRRSGKSKEVIPAFEFNASDLPKTATGSDGSRIEITKVSSPLGTSNPSGSSCQEMIGVSWNAKMAEAHGYEQISYAYVNGKWVAQMSNFFDSGKNGSSICQSIDAPALKFRLEVVGYLKVIINLKK
jgi:hypothetical protein